MRYNNARASATADVFSSTFFFGKRIKLRSLLHRETRNRRVSRQRPGNFQTLTLFRR